MAVAGTLRAAAGPAPLSSLGPLADELSARNAALSVLVAGLESDRRGCSPAWAASLRNCLAPIADDAVEFAARARRKIEAFEPGPYQLRPLKWLEAKVAELELLAARLRHQAARFEDGARSRHAIRYRSDLRQRRTD